VVGLTAKAGSKSQVATERLDALGDSLI